MLREECIDCVSFALAGMHLIYDTEQHIDAHDINGGVTMILRRLFAAVLIQAALFGTAMASSSPATMTRESVFSADDLSALSLGVDVHRQERAIRDEGTSAVVAVPELNWVTAFVGLDIAPSMTIFATAGQCDISEGSAQAPTDDGLRWSLGMSLNLLTHGVPDPAARTGSLSLHAVLEAVYVRLDLDSAGSSTTMDWNELSLSLPVAYEVYAEGIGSIEAPYSLTLYAGPVFSPVEGRIEHSGKLLDKFESDNDFGLIAGADVFLSENFSLGVKTTYFDEASLGATIRYHF